MGRGVKNFGEECSAGLELSEGRKAVWSLTDHCSKIGGDTEMEEEYKGKGEQEEHM